MERGWDICLLGEVKKAAGVGGGAWAEDGTGAESPLERAQGLEFWRGSIQSGNARE